MSMSMGGSEVEEYADHDVHHIRHQVKYTGGEASEPGLNDVRTFDVTETGIDHDELAELRAMRVVVGTAFGADQPEDSVGSVDLNLNAGYNLAEAEVISTGESTELIDIDQDGDNDIQVKTNETDEVGQLWNLATSVSAPYDDDANGNGGGGQFVLEAEWLDFDRLFNGGPVLDATDNFTSILGLNDINNEASLGVDVRYSLYYAVEQAQGGRARFSR